MKIHNAAQNTDEWRLLRAGIPTASAFSKIITPKTRKLSKQADSYMHWLIAEWILGTPLESPETSHMQRGHELEPFAAEAYEFETGNPTDLVGFITTDDGLIGASPDRLSGDVGMVEIKCPTPAVHVGYLVSEGVDEDYWTQLQGQLYVATDREWVDTISYCTPFPNAIVRVTRDDAFQVSLGEALNEFVDRMLKARSKLEDKYGPFERKQIVSVGDEFGEFGVSDEDVEAILAHQGSRK